MNEWFKEGFLISTDKAYLNVDLIHTFLSKEAYWSKGIPKEIVQKSIDNTALCFGVYKHEVEKEQVGFARVISDLATFAYLADVFILPKYRQLGLSKWLMNIITSHSELHGLRRFMLATDDAHTLYEQYGFERVEDASKIMQKLSKPSYQV